MKKSLTCILVVALVTNAQDGFITRTHNSEIITEPVSLEIILGETQTVDFRYIGNEAQLMTLKLSEKPYFSLSRSNIPFSADNNKFTVEVTGKQTTSREFVDIESCSQPDNTNCSISIDNIFVTIVVMRNHVFKWLIELTGWTYFVAWSLSFYPQAIMNFRRKSVVGFSLDYGLLNIIGFLCYSIYNCSLYFDPAIQDLYIEKHPRGAIPVLLNDVVFAVHAFVVCSITGIQCLIYTRGSQRVSYVCWAWISIFGIVAAVSLSLRAFGIFDWLQFISALSYIKLAVTCSKYIPPAIYNFQRKSTIGWSIGTIFLDFSGGIMGLLQMILQAANTDDWSIFAGNAVKCGLGVASVCFDVLFMVQHFCLYTHHQKVHKITISKDKLSIQKHRF